MILVSGLAQTMVCGQGSARARWAAAERRQDQVGDERLNFPLVQLVATLADAPESTLPQALQSWADVKAAYRCRDNPRRAPEEVLAAHRQATLERGGNRDLTLLAEDTTQFDFSGRHGVQGWGPTGATGLPRFFRHWALGMTVEGIPPAAARVRNREAQRGAPAGPGPGAPALAGHARRQARSGFAPGRAWRTSVPGMPTSGSS